MPRVLPHLSARGYPRVTSHKCKGCFQVTRGLTRVPTLAFSTREPAASRAGIDYPERRVALPPPLSAHGKCVATCGPRTSCTGPSFWEVASDASHGARGPIRLEPSGDRLKRSQRQRTCVSPPPSRILGGEEESDPGGRTPCVGWRGLRPIPHGGRGRTGGGVARGACRHRARVYNPLPSEGGRGRSHTRPPPSSRPHRRHDPAPPLAIRARHASQRAPLGAPPDSWCRPAPKGAKSSP